MTSALASLARAFLAASSLVACTGAQALEASVSAAPPSQSGEAAVLSAESLRATVTYMADDARAGRSTGSVELNEVGRWLATELERAGVAPGGDDGGYLQRVPIARFEYESKPSVALLDADGTPTQATYGIDFDGVVGGVPESELALVVVRTAEELPEQPSASTALYLDVSSRREQRTLLEQAGAGWGLVVRRGSQRAGRRELTGPPRPRRLAGEVPQASLRLRGPMAAACADGSVKRLQVTLPGKRVDLETYNVVGVLRGAGSAERPDLARETIVLSAHYDHIGLNESAEEGEDKVYNGADDDASGCAAVLELARVLGSEPAPARTLVFLFATGEEIGLVGTDHYISQPLVPLEDTVCNLNFEMIGRPDALVGGAGKLWLTGHERSNLGPAFSAAGVSVVADPRPEQNFFRRSDNYAFAELGIVAQTLSSYDLHEDYHHVSDETELLDFEHMRLAVEASVVCTRALASGAIDPAWEPGGKPQ